MGMAGVTSATSSRVERLVGSASSRSGSGAPTRPRVYPHGNAAPGVHPFAVASPRVERMMRLRPSALAR
jgi:hypothetical protein